MTEVHRLLVGTTSGYLLSPEIVFLQFAIMVFQLLCSISLGYHPATVIFPWSSLSAAILFPLQCVAWKYIIQTLCKTGTSIRFGHLSCLRSLHFMELCAMISDVFLVQL